MVGRPGGGRSGSTHAVRPGDRAGAAHGAVEARHTFATLDLLRGVAALAVLLYHAAFVFSVAPPAEGQLAVDLFFVMSGFIIAYRYDRDLAGAMRVGRFATIRLIRLYPLFLLGTMLGAIPAIVAVSSGSHEPVYPAMLAALPRALLMLPAHAPSPDNSQVLYPLNFVSWSLALEIVANVAYAATFRFWTPRRLALALVAGFLGLVVCAVRDGTLSYGWGWPHAFVGVARVFWGFFAGVALQRVYRAGFTFPRLGWWLPVVLALALFFVQPPAAIRAVWELAACVLAVPAIASLAIASEPPRRLAGLCAVAGVYSYVLYSLHAPVIGIFLRVETRFHLALHGQSAADALMFVALLGAACVAANTLYDRPVRLALVRRLRERDARSQPVLGGGAASGIAS